MTLNPCNCEDNGPKLIGSGTQVKLEVSNQPIGELTMDDYYFELEAYTTAGGRRTQLIKKDETVRKASDRYAFIVDTSLLGTGELWIDQTAFIPDADAPGGTRKEVSINFTNMIVIKNR